MPTRENLQTVLFKVKGLQPVLKLIQIHFSRTVAWITALNLWVSVWQYFRLTSLDFDLTTAINNPRFHNSCLYYIFTFQTQVSKATDVSMNLKLTLAQLHLAQGSVFQACDTLKNLGDLSYAPGIVSMMCFYYCCWLSFPVNEVAVDLWSNTIAME